LLEFDKRYAMYLGVTNLIADCLTETVEMKHIYEYRAATISAEFLYRKEIADYVEALRVKATTFVAILVAFRKQNDINLRAGAPDGMSIELILETRRIEMERRKFFTFFEQQYDQAKEKFFEHLSIE
jgi:hypothetical protein